MTFILRNEFVSNYSFGIKTRPDNPNLTISKNEILDTELFEFRGFDDELTQRLVQKIKSNSKPLSNYCQSTSGFGGKSEMISDYRINKAQIEVVKGKSISRYGKLNKYYFEFNSSNITGRTRDEKKLGKQSKIFLRKTGADIIATYDDSGIYPEQSLYFLYDFRSSPLYLLGIINSRLINWYYSNRLVTNEDSTPQLKNFDLDSFPIVIASENTINLIEKAVAQIMKLQEDGKDYHSLDQKLDQIVYRLYGLSYLEVMHIDPHFVLTKNIYEAIDL